MENRRHERIVESLEAEIVSNGTVYSCIVMNFSAEGLYIVTATASSIVEIAPSTILQLNCTLPSGSRLSMDCKIIWFQTKPSSHGVAFSLGLEIVDPPEEYKDFLDNVCSPSSD
jgi:hypothetical protein